MENNKYIKKKVNKDFLLEMLQLAEIAAGADGDTIEFTLTERDGIRMDVSISFSYSVIHEKVIPEWMRRIDNG